jgi:hypothetical protein
VDVLGVLPAGRKQKAQSSSFLLEDGKINGATTTTEIEQNRLSVCPTGSGWKWILEKVDFGETNQNMMAAAPTIATAATAVINLSVGTTAITVSS